ncbi:MAG: helix-turn-helix transcriptional regulator [Ferruginibacter sp.]
MQLLSITENMLLVFCSLGVLQGILLAALLYFHPRADKNVNRFLALYIFCTSMIMSLPLMLRLIGWQNSFFIMPLPLLPGPLLYLYLLSFKQTITWKKALPHFIIFFLFFIAVKWNLSVLTKLFPNTAEVPAAALRRPATIAMSYSRSIQQLLYFFLARRALLSYQHSIKHLFSETSRIDLRWAKYLVNGYLVLIVTFIIIFPLIIRFPEYFNLLLLINMAVATPYIYIATYKGIFQPTIWQLKPELNKEVVEEQIQEADRAETIITETVIETPKAVKTGLPSGRSEEIAERITTLMEKEKLFQEPELTLQQLAGRLDVPNYLVSLALNEGMKKTFYDLVNGYRVEEAKRLLLDAKNKNFTILSVGFEAGFNSKTTFNTVFKKFTGLTPTEFRERNKEAVETIA